MESVKKAELWLNDLFTKKQPFQLPRPARKSLANISWLIVLVLGVLAMLAVLDLWDAGRQFLEYADSSRYLSRLYGPADGAPSLGIFYYAPLVLMTAQVVLFLMAVQGLKDHSKSKGWDLAFYALLIHILIGVLGVFADVPVFSGVDPGIGTLFAALVGTTIVGYFLFQIREYFTDKPKDS